MSLFQKRLKAFADRLVVNNVRTDPARLILAIVLPCGKVLLNDRGGDRRCLREAMQQAALTLWGIPFDQQIIGEVVAVDLDDGTLNCNFIIGSDCAFHGTPRSAWSANLMLEEKDILWHVG